MNKHCYRIVFNQHRGTLMAVADHASSVSGKTSGGEAGPRPSLIATLKPMCFALWLAGGMVSAAAIAGGVVADANAPKTQQPTVVTTASGTPQVNIQTPSAAGVSRNTYSQFNVDGRGVILNNARTDAATQIGGWVQGNPWLATGSARVILNEVNSSNPSLLNGYVEVAGQRADVVIANPSGLQVGGAGFINAGRVTLTTGTPILNNGALEGFRVQQGLITVSGAGLDTSRADYTDLIARSVNVNAGIWASNLKVVTGANQVSAEAATATPIAGSGSAPAYALDVAALGGMYAGKIALVGTESGLGVRNAGQIGASAGQVSISADGMLHNSGSIAGSDGLRINTADVTNTGSLATNGTLAINTGTLTNRGLIDGATARIDANQVDNLGSGRIYGDQLAIQAGTLNNLAEGGTAPVIGARAQLDLGVGTLNNREHALIFSAGNMSIGGGLDANGFASGSAGTLNNNSASIEALGDLSISTARLNNTNEHFSTQVFAVGSPEHRVEYQGGGWTARYLEGTPDVWVYEDESDHLHTPDGNFESWNKYDYTRNVAETRVVETDPGKITAGGNFSLNAAVVLNDRSRMLAGGNIAGSIGDLQNIEAPATRTVTEYGNVMSFWRDHHKGRDSTGSSTALYAPAPVITNINLRTAVFQPNASPADIGSSLAAVTEVPATGGSTSIVRTVSSGSGLPTSVLFSAVPGAPNGYLIESDPRFTNYRAWLSSDYLLNQLSANPANMQKRLGDGYYEQKLVRDQIAQLTGRRFLDGYANDEAQYRALLDNARTVAGAWNLIPGVALTSAQMAQLTSDIVWLVERQVTLPNGQTTRALVPQVYVRVKPGDIDGTGALIAGRNANIQLAGELRNSGTIAGREVLALSANTVNNLGGRLTAKDVSVDAAQDLNVTGGSIDASNSLTATAGRDLNVQAATRTTSNAQGSVTNVARVAGLYVTDAAGGDLVAAAGNNLNVRGAEIGNQATAGTTTLAAGQDVNIGTVATSRDQRIRWDDKNYRNDSSRDEAGSSISTSGDLRIAAGNDLVARGATVSSDKGAITATAGRDIRLEAARTTTALDEGHQHSGKSGMFTKRTVTTRDTQEDTTTRGSTLSGNSVTLAAGRDLAAEGAGVAGTTATTLAAGRDVSITAATETHSESHLFEEKKKGFSATPSSISYGKSSARDTSQSQSTTAAAATVGAVDGKLTVQAGRKVAVTGSDLLAGTDIAVSGQEVRIEAAEQTAHSESTSERKQSGISIGAAGTMYDGYRNVRDATKSKGTFNKITRTEQAISANGATAPQVAVTFGRSQSSSSTVTDEVTHRAATVGAGGNVSIVATGTGVTDAQGKAADGDIRLAGSSLTAGKAVQLDAARNVDITAVTDTYRETTTSSASSKSFSTAVITPGDSMRHTTGGPNHSGVKASPYNTGKSSDDRVQTATTEQASLINGDSISVLSRAGDIGVSGSALVAGGDVNLRAVQGNIDIQAGTNTQTLHTEHHGRQVGDLGSNATETTSGTSNTVGVRTQNSQLDSNLDEQSKIRSAITSHNGSVTVDAKEDLSVHGADLAAAKDLTLIGRNVDIDAGQDSRLTRQSQDMKQFGVTASLSGYAVEAFKAVEKAANAVEGTERGPNGEKQDARLTALYVAKAAVSVYNTVDQVSASVQQGNWKSFGAAREEYLAKQAEAGSATSAADAAAGSTGTNKTAQGNLNGAAANKAGNTGNAAVKLTVSIGMYSSKSESESAATLNQGSTLKAQTVNVVATGSGATDAAGNATDGDITMRGTRIDATDVNLAAARDITLQSVADTTRDTASNSSHNASIGVGFGLGGSQNGFTLELAAGGARGMTDGESQTHRNTVINASNQFTSESGRDTTLAGAVVNAKRVDMAVGRDLNIESRQDIDNYKTNQQDVGFAASICVPPFCYGETVSASASESHSRVDSTYRSVVEQSGINAGSGGYDIAVKRDTTLTGAVIASTASAENNRLTTGTLVTRDLTNTASYGADSGGMSLSYGTDSSVKSAIKSNVLANAQANAIPGQEDQASGTTRSAISPGTIVITDEAAQQARTGQSAAQTLASLNRDTAHANDGALEKIFDREKVANEQAVRKLGAEVASQVAPVIYKQIAAIGIKQMEPYLTAEAKRDAAAEQLANSSDPVEKRVLQAIVDEQNAVMAANKAAYIAWDEGGPNRVALHALAGAGLAAMGGGNALGGAVAGGANAAAVPALDELTKGMTDKEDINLVHELAAFAIGGSINGLGSAGFNVQADQYNRKITEHQIAKTRAEAAKNHADAEQYFGVLCVKQDCTKQAIGFTTDDPRAARWMEQGLALQKSNPTEFERIAKQLEEKGILEGAVSNWVAQGLATPGALAKAAADKIGNDNIVKQGLNATLDNHASTVAGVGVFAQKLGEGAFAAQVAYLKFINPFTPLEEQKALQQQAAGLVSNLNGIGTVAKYPVLYFIGDYGKPVDQFANGIADSYRSTYSEYGWKAAVTRGFLDVGSLLFTPEFRGPQVAVVADGTKVQQLSWRAGGETAWATRPSAGQVVLQPAAYDGAYIQQFLKAYDDAQALRAAEAASKGGGGATAAEEYVNILSPAERQHILFGDAPGSGGHMYPGQLGKTTFPQNWTEGQILHNVGDVVTSPTTQWYAQTGTGGAVTKAGDPARWVAWETRDGVSMRVVYEPATGRTITAFPDSAPTTINLKPISK